jgi:two-component system, NarL family, nitrate/nitrite response regulator NarL
MSTHSVAIKSICRPDDRRHPYGFLIVSGIRFLSEGLAEILAREPWIVVSGISNSLVEAILMSRALQPDFILLDAALDGGLTAVSQFRDAVPCVRVVALAIMETEQEVISWAEAGVAGYIPRTAALADLVQLLSEINEDRQPCSSRVAFCLLRRVASTEGVKGKACDIHGSTSHLTSRELQISALISSGYSNKEIARQLNIGLSTTKSHVHNLLGKLNLQRRGQVVDWTRGARPAPLRARTPTAARLLA